jgi:putative DNA primase/helicase
MDEAMSTEERGNAILNMMHELYSIGVMPIPFKKNLKEPAVPEWRSYQKARPSEEEVRDLFLRAGPEANIGFITGEISNLDVIDLDVGHEPWPFKDCPLPSAHIVKTPHGGYHRHTKHVKGARCSKGRIARRIDVRADGGVIMYPPSIIDGKPYVVESGSLLEALHSETPPCLQDVLRASHRSKRTSPTRPTRIPEGERNSCLTSQAGSMRRRGMTEEAIFAALLKQNETQCDPPLPEAEVRSIARSIGKKESIIGLAATPEYSDAWNARQYVEQYEESLHYCPADNAWYYWNGTLWVRDNSLHVERLAQEFALGQYSKASEILDSDERRKWVSHVKYSESKRGITSMIHLARSLGKVPVASEELDANDMVLNTQSGTIDFDQEELVAKLEKHNPSDLITKICPVEYNPSAESELWDKFLKDVTHGDKELELFLQRCAGYSLVGINPQERFFFIFGDSCTGKSTFIEAIKATLGKYAIGIDASTFLEQRNSGGPQPEIVKLKGARIIIANETKPGKKFKADLIKGLSGRDTIACRDLYSKPIEFRFGGKLWLVSNFAPAAAVEDDALMRRLIIIPFTNRIPESKRDPEMKTALTDPMTSGAAILNWMIQGYLDYRDIGLSIPDCVHESIRNYKEGINPLTDWVAECCAMEPGNSTLSESAADLLKNFNEWIGGDFKDKMKPISFGRCLKAMGLEPTRRLDKGKKARSWQGIKLNH